ncbi:MAG: sugar ABC transporter permease [Phycisphaeraceae bacterium]|nr:MAG: sugar ABC transporter permease [Phycisphaeraceae bacterium]
MTRPDPESRRNPPGAHLGAGGSAYAFLFFPMAILTVFVLAPTIIGLGLSFFEWKGGPLWTGAGGWNLPTFVGLQHYRSLLSDPDIRHGLINTIAFVVGSVPISVLVAFVLAVAVNSPWFRGKALVRTLLFMPTIVSIVAVGFVWRWVLNDSAGILNWFLSLLGYNDPPNWLADGYWPLFWIVVVQIWRQIGFCLVLYLAALQAVSPSLYEAAAIDGATRLGSVRHITWPMVAPMTAFLMVTGVISALQVFDLVFIMTGENETRYTTVLNLEIFREFSYGSFGYAAAIGVLIFVITIAATALQLAAFGTRHPKAAGRAAK